MYLPPHFDASADTEALMALVRRDPFITLVTWAESAPLANHLPVLLDRAPDGGLRIRGHWARANPQWQGIQSQTVLAIVHGPHAYVSPRWYPDPLRAVPTWNYAAAHLSGRVSLVTEADALLSLVGELAQRFEPAEAPWQLVDAMETGRRMAGAIVGFELRVERIELKQKLSQNHDASRVIGAMAGLRAEAGTAGAEVAALMEQVLARQRA